MRILMFTNTYLPHVGGVARSVETFAADLRSAANRVLIIAPVFPGHEAQDEKEPEIVRVPAMQQFNGSDFSVRIPIPFYLDEIIDEFAPEIVHSHHPYLLGDAALRVARRRGLPLVFTHHTLYEAYAHHIHADSDTFKAFVIRLATQYANMCNHVVAPSQSLADIIRGRGVETPITEVATGVDLKFFASGDGPAFRKQYGIPDKATLIGHVGRLAAEKNLDFLVRAVAQTLETCPDTWFLVVGEGPKKDEICEHLKKTGLANRLIMTGSLSGSPLAGAYQAMDLFAFSSRTETQGLVLAEAMAAGTPVAALDAPGVREVVRDNINGRLLPEDASPKTLSTALTELVRTLPDRNADLGRKALETADAYGREASRRKLTALYQELMETLKQKRPHQDAGVMEPWEALLGGIQAEWDLLTQKTVSLMETLGALQETKGG